MNSYVNFNKTDDEKVKIIDLPNAFKDYLFDFDYPLDDELKPQFEENFLTHYMMRRIGFDTYMSFKIHLKDKLNTIMPKYNKMLLEFTNIDFRGVKETHTKEYTKNVDESNNENTTGTTSGTFDNRFSSLPQNEIQDVQNGSYITDYTYNTNNGTMGGTLTGTKSNDEEYSETLEIDKGDPTDEYIKVQDKINNIYDMIYKELNCLFFQVV
jgi:hypothetical protein